MLQKWLGKRAMHPLKRRLQAEPYYRFSNFEEVALAASWGVAIDANTASVDDWLRLPGISIHQARGLVRLTQQGVAFNCIEDVAAALNLPPAQIQGWSPLLKFFYYEPDAALEPARVNVNQASAEQLAAVPGIDIVLARGIIHYRQAGPYADLADLQQRLRLNIAKTSELLHYLSF